MHKFSSKSIANLSLCDKRLQDIAYEAINYIDFSVICGHRTEKEQEKAYRSGNSKLRYPYSKHNSIPSKAMDLTPYPLDWEDIESFYHLADIILEVADKQGVNLLWGGHWSGFRDYPHFELRD